MTSHPASIRIRCPLARPVGLLRACTLSRWLLPFCALSISFAVVAAEPESPAQPAPDGAASQASTEEEGAADTTSKPPAPLFRRTSPTPRGRWGSILSKGPAGKEQVVTGRISFTPGKRLQLQDPDKQEPIAVNPFQVRRVDVEIESESMEREWRWIAMGSDEKELTGRSYPDRTYRFTVCMEDGTVHRGRFLGFPVYVETEGGARTRFIVRPRQRGDFGEKPEDLVYVAGICFHDEAEEPPWELKKDDPIPSEPAPAPPREVEPETRRDVPEPLPEHADG